MTNGINRSKVVLQLMDKNPMQLFKEEFPELADRFDQLVEAQRQLDGLEKKTKQLINIAIQTANRNPRGVMFHAMMAKTAGASRKEVLGAVAMNLHLSGLAAVLESLPAAVEGYDKK
jgi:AhpD family alkylhydroperoxidase